MNLRKELTQIDIASAINTAVEDLFPRFTKNKVLVVHLQMTIQNLNANN